jgi:hypothetical protein
VELPRFPLQPVEPGLFAALGSLALPGEWQIRVSANLGGRFVAKRFDVNVPAATEAAGVADAGEEGRAAAAGESFQQVLTVLAGAVAIVGSLVLAYDVGIVVRDFLSWGSQEDVRLRGPSAKRDSP